MKYRKLINAFFTLLFIVTLSGVALASTWESFNDISGHWAEKTIQKGFNDGLITGIDDSTVAPDSPITTAQMITILCRVLGARENADISKLGIAPDAWYADAAGKALYLGLISTDTGNLDLPMSRQDALSMMAKAFCLTPAEPDYTVLNAYTDAGSISAKNKGAIAALVSKKLINGFDGSLAVNSSITRAEFLTVLYRVASNYVYADNMTSGKNGGIVIKGSGTLNFIQTDNIWFDCSADNINISGVSAETITLRNHNLSNFNLYGNNNISKLAVNVGKGKMSIGSSGNTKIGLLQLESCEGADVGSDASSIEITGSGVPVNISGKHDDLIITGNNNVITLSPDVSLSRLKISGENNSVVIKDSSPYVISCDEIEISGKTNTVAMSIPSDKSAKLTVNGIGNKISSQFGNISALDVLGTKADIKVSFHTGLSGINVTGNENTVLLSCAAANTESANVLNESADASSSNDINTATVSGNSNWITLSCRNISSLSISGKYNTINKLGMGSILSVDLPGSENAFTLKEGGELQTAKITGSSNQVTLNGIAQSITIAGSKTTLSGNGSVKSLTINAYGCTIKVSAESVTDNSNQAEIDRVLKLVTLGYNGNFTLKWALEHDYQTYEKEIWVNAKGYTSSTEYLIWVNLSMQRVNIFKNNAGRWALCHSCIVGTGAPGRGTPVGVWRTTYKSWAGWTTSTYTVKPVVGFKENTGYAFHSRLYAPGTTNISDASIGYPVSHGCVRMYDADIKYIYDNIPLGTTVVVY